MTEGSNGFAALAPAIGIASEVHKRNSEQTNLTQAQVRGILNREPPMGADKSGVKQFFGRKELGLFLIEGQRSRQRSGMLRTSF